MLPSCLTLGMCFTGTGQGAASRSRPGHTRGGRLCRWRKYPWSNSWQLLQLAGWAQGNSTKSYSGSREAPLAPHLLDTGDRERDHNNSHVVPGAPPALTLAGKAHWEQGWTITAASLMDFSSSISRSRCCIHHVLRNQQLCSKPSCSEAPAGTIPQPDTILPGDTARGTARGSDSSAEPCP